MNAVAPATRTLAKQAIDEAIGLLEPAMHDLSLDLDTVSIEYLGDNLDNVSAMVKLQLGLHQLREAKALL